MNRDGGVRVDDVAGWGLVPEGGVVGRGSVLGGGWEVGVRQMISEVGVRRLEWSGKNWR